MSLTVRVVLLTFIESFATILLERGAYFFTRQQLAFSDTMNLLAALTWGVAYVVGALVSHRLARRGGERRMLAVAVGGQLVGHLLLAAWPTTASMLAGLAAIGWLNGMKWPIVESYVGAGHTPASAARAVARFNVSWALAVPVSLMAAGPLIAWWPVGLFLLAAGVNAVSLIVIASLPRRPAHLPEDHPERPDAAGLSRYVGLLSAARWQMLASYSLMWIVAALIPGILDRLSVSVSAAPGLSGLIDWLRTAAFVLLGLWAGWHRRRWPIALGAVLLPVGFVMILCEASLPVVLAGEVLFGLAAGVVYFAALYYALVVKNASVDAGGGHEGLIGAGFALGPLLGLLGERLADPLGGEVIGRLAGAAPVVILCGLAAVRSLLRTPK